MSFPNRCTILVEKLSNNLQTFQISKLHTNQVAAMSWYIQSSHKIWWLNEFQEERCMKKFGNICREIFDEKKRELKETDEKIN